MRQLLLYHNFSIRVENCPLLEKFFAAKFTRFGVFAKQARYVFIGMDLDFKAASIDDGNVSVVVFLCRGDFRDALATNLDGDTVSQNDDIKIIGVVVAFACGGNFVANRVVLLYRLLFYDRERCCIVEKAFSLD